MTYNKDSKIILTDCDGVVLWWEQAFHEWMQSRGHVKLYSNTYSLHEHYEGLSAEQAMRDIIEFNGSSWNQRDWNQRGGNCGGGYSSTCRNTRRRYSFISNGKIFARSTTTHDGWW